MTQRMTDEQLEREIRRFLEWQSRLVAGAPTEAEMTQRIGQRQRSQDGGGARRLVLVFAVLGLVATMGVGLLLTGVGSGPSDRLPAVVRPTAVPAASTRATETSVSPAPASPTTPPASPVAPTASPPPRWSPGPLPDPQPVDTSSKVALSRLVGRPVDDGVVVSAAEDGGVWLAPAHGSVLVHVDPELRPTRYPLPYDRLILGEPIADGEHVWLQTQGSRDPESLDLLRLDVTARTFRSLRTHATPVGVSAEGLWVLKFGVPVLLDPTTGDTRRALELPSDVASLYAFDSFWGYTWSEDGPIVRRWDERTGELMATVPLASCAAGAPSSSHEAAFHRGRLYAVRPDASALSHLLVASCPADADHATTGPDVLISPATNAIVGTIDLGAEHSGGAAVGGRWWVRTAGSLPDGLLLADAGRGRATVLLGLASQGSSRNLVASGRALWLVLSGCGNDRCDLGEFPPFLLRLSAETLEDAIGGAGD